MAVPTNILENVQTYTESGLALLSNMCPFVSSADTKYKEFNKDIPMNLGDTVKFDLPPRFVTTNSLVLSDQPAEQREHSLKVDEEGSVSYAFTAQQFVLNVDDYMDRFGESATAELAVQIESNVAQVAETNTFRFFGDGVTPISSYVQLANALAYFKNFGAAKGKRKAFLNDLAIPAIVNSGLNQFVPKGNEELRNSWELGFWNNTDWMESNLLPTHTAGTEGQQGSTLTVVSTTKNSSGGVTSITFSGCNAAGDADSIKQYDKFQFSDGVSGYSNLRFRTFVGHKVSQSPVQFKATADAASTGGSQVEVSIYPPLQAAAGREQNINTEIVAGMQCTVLPNHRCGLIYSNNPFFVAMPPLPDEVPFPTGVAVDEDTGISMRQYYGCKYGENRRGMAHDAIWGKTLVDEYAMMIAFPE